MYAIISFQKKKKKKIKSDTQFLLKMTSCYENYTFYIIPRVVQAADSFLFIASLCFQILVYPFYQSERGKIWGYLCTFAFSRF